MQKLAVLSKHYSVDVKLAPSMFELSSSNHKSEMDLRSLDYPDLLGRPLISIDRQPILDMIQGKRVMVTGAGGSIGSEICRQLKSFHPAQLLLLDIDETELHDLSLELHDYQQEFSQDIFPICCDIKNKEKIDEIFRTFKPQIVFHAAAYKHVPMMELYPEEAIRTNIPGSYNIMTAAKANHAEKVIVISTDKAVNPTNVMGATKRVVEMEAALLTSDETPIVCVRFGNVLGSRGSMLPLFFQQIKAGVPITVTDKNIIRYFMAIPEAVGLVFRAGAMGNGGEVMVLDMGEPVKIYDFAEKLIDIYGDKERNKIIITGLRPGEKLYEELLANKDNTIPTTNKRIFKAKVTGTLQKETFEKMLSTIEQDDTKTLLANLNAVVPEYTPKPCKSWESYTELA
jgi:FlaA1/EpsC-like NDP-sugar epimerase